MEATKIWIVFQGEYDGRVIHSVWSSEEKAEKASNRIGGTYEPYNVDEFTEALNNEHSFWNVVLSYNGEVKHIEETDFTDDSPGYFEYRLHRRIYVARVKAVNKDAAIEACQQLYREQLQKAKVFSYERNEVK